MRPLEPSEPLTGLIVILRGAPSHMSLLVSEVNRNFSRASLAFEMSSRRNTSLMPNKNVSKMMRRTDEPVRVKTGPRRVSDGKKPWERKQTCLLRSYEDGQHHSNLRVHKLMAKTARQSRTWYWCFSAETSGVRSWAKAYDTRVTPVVRKRSSRISAGSWSG
jgi:hypothetical protein